jgi:hypothetical protein
MSLFHYYAKGTGSCPGLKRPGRGVNHPQPYRAEIKERVELYLCAFLAGYRVEFAVTFFKILQS